MYTKHIATVALLGAVALAKDHRVKVGQNALAFVPASITAEKGDTVSFQIFPNHNVQESAFSSPCKYMSGGISSGNPYEPSNDAGRNADPNLFVVTINDTTPIYGFCSEASHCENGMVFVINPPSSGDTLSAYTSDAMNASGSSGSAAVLGGTYEKSVVAPSAGSSSSSAAASSSSASASSSSASASSSSASASSSSASASSASASSSSASASSSSASASAAATSSTSSSSGFANSNTAAGSFALMVAGFAAYLL